ncbi:MAG: endoglucanase [Azospirillum brasilense]|nr:MAG: endoglucanase [Azospirillum brasilense]
MASSLTYNVASDWGAGFVANMAIQAGDSALNGWLVEFDAAFTITNLWGGEIVSHVGTHYVVRNLSWNAAISANGQASFGFQATSGSAGSQAANLALNGTTATPPAALPEISVADVSVAEGNGGTKLLAFTVALSKAASGPVTLHYATADGTATAGSDYAAASGTLTFAAGETSKTISIAIAGDTAVEANEGFLLNLSGASGATIARASATGTILNDDTAPLPRLSVSDISVTEGNPGTSGTGSGTAATGWFSTRGNQIVDAEGDIVFGLESSNEAPHGLWARGYKEMMDQMVELGFNTIRLPFSTDLLHGGTPSGIDFSKNPDLQGLTGLQIMDRIVDYAGQIGLRIILDHHRSDAGAGTSGNGLWYDAAHPESQWISDWQMLAARYADDPTVIGADLHNEPYNGTWGTGTATDWAAAAERAGNAIGSVNPNWLIFVEGIGTYDGQSYWWGGNLMGVRDRPVTLDVANKLVYSAHDYPNSIYAQPWFQSADFGDTLTQKFDQIWGYIYKEGIAPVYLGEFGTRMADAKDLVWLDKITAYLSGDLDANGTHDIAAGQQGISWTWWSWNPNSGDTGGILQDDWTSVNTAKLAELQPIQFNLDGSTVTPGTTGDAHVALFTVTLSAASASEVTVDFSTTPGTATAEDFTSLSGKLTFAPGETSKTVAIAIKADSTAEADETFSLLLSSPSGATILDGTGTATILNDDGTPSTGGSTGGSTGTGLDASFAVTNAWNSGFQGAVTVHNEGTTTVSNWEFELKISSEITQIWNAEIVSRTSSGYIIHNAAWNGGIAGDGEVSFGFLASGQVNPAQVDFVF